MNNEEKIFELIYKMYNEFSQKFDSLESKIDINHKEVMTKLNILENKIN